MRPAIVITVLVTLLFVPASCLVGAAVLLNPAAQASCIATGSVTVGQVPDELVATTTDGVRVSLTRQQLDHAATIITAGSQTQGVGRDGVIVALTAALTESGLRMLSNTSAYPESADHPNNGDGGDHDSLGLFQMRPSMGWGTLAELMDPAYQAGAFYGGPTGPNRGAPRGLLDIAGWQQMPNGAAAQAVEGSAYPDRYAAYEPVAEAIVDAITRPNPPQAQPSSLPETSRVVFPLPSDTWVRTSGFGERTHPLTAEVKLHTGADYAAPAGTPILAVADGRVASVGAADGYGNLILIEHTVSGRRVTSGYAHMSTDGLRVRAGDTVAAGQHIADVGSTGYSTGPHLHVEIRPGSPGSAPVDPEPWLASEGAAPVPGSQTAGAAGGCTPAGTVPAGEPAPSDASHADRVVDDPTSDGQITARTAHVLAQVRAAFPRTAWACWSPRPGTGSEHPLGRACDGTFGNALGQYATGPALELGWNVTNWLKAHAADLGVEYLIWQGRIWSLSRTSEGWRAYDGGGMHNPSDATGGHYDHLHFTVGTGR